jgi:hypothetical protein
VLVEEQPYHLDGTCFVSGRRRMTKMDMTMMSDAKRTNAPHRRWHIAARKHCATAAVQKRRG